MRDAVSPSAPSRGNLPAALTSFVGRERELAEVRRLLGETRLLTLTGAGGVGKTRLALEVGGGLLDGYADGVWLVELAPLADPDLAPQAVARGLGVRETPGQPILTTVLISLRTSRLLLLLDNCEHLVEACAALADRLLRACPGVTILATSREALGITGEVGWRTPSLDAPAPGEPAPPERLAEYAAVELFIDRARAAQPAFTLTARNAPAVAQVCRALDGIPLALELAAARVRALTVEEIAARLDDRLRLLTGGSRAAPPRQRTLRATLDWSYDLLAEPERALFRRLAVFAGGWTLEAAEAVGAGDGLAADAVLDPLTELVAKSLALADAGAVGETRYRLLETARQYALERLEASGEAEAARERHARYFQALAEWPPSPGPSGSEWNQPPMQAAWHTQVLGEYDNVRATMRWLIEREEWARGLRLGVRLRVFWQINGHLLEGRAYLAEVLRRSESTDLALERAWGFFASGLLARNQGSMAGARAPYEAGLALFRRLGHRYGIGHSQMNLGWLAQMRGDYAEAHRLYAESRALFEELGDERGLDYLITWLGDLARDEGDFDAARPLLEEARRRWRATGALMMRAVATVRLGALHYLRGDHAAARILMDEALEFLRAFPDGARPPYLHVWPALLGVAEGRHHEARVRAEASLAASTPEGDVVEACSALEVLAQVEVADGRPGQALLLAGAAAGQRERLGTPLAPSLSRKLDEGLDAARRALGPGAATAAWSAGRAMTLEQAVAEALVGRQRRRRGRTPSLPSHQAGASLTP